MCRLLIADDEDLVRRGLTALLQREAPDITMVGAATDGLEALAMATHHRPDLVLTDIRMPGLNGLELIARLRALDPAPRCIILSGYDEFDYARRAIALGVTEYLLKPVDPDDLLQLLQRTVARIVTERCERLEQVTALRTAAEHSLRRIVYEQDANTGAIAACLPTAPAWGLLLIQPRPNTMQGSLQAAIEQLTAICASVLPEAVMADDAYGYLCALHPLSGEAQARAEAAACLVHRALKDAGWSVAITVARPRERIAEIAMMYQEALEAAEYSAVADNDDRPLPVWELLPSRAERWPALPIAHRDALLQAITAGNQADAMRTAETFMTYLRTHLPAGGTRTVWAEMVVLVIHHAQQLGIRADDLVGPRQNLRSLLVDTVDASTLERQFVTLAVRAATQAQALRIQELPRGAIAELRAYVEGHLAGDLTITTLARLVHLNAKYLGELFKSVTGEPLGEFIIRSRMRYACALLAESPLKVYAVAEHVGYGNPKHFATMFRVHMGVTPAEYREQHRQASHLPAEPSP